MKKILLISPFFYPERISTGLFNTKIVKQLESKSCEVDVWCSHPFYPEWKPVFSALKDVGHRIVRMGRYIKYPKTLVLRRFVLELWFFFAVCGRLLRNREKYDVIIAHVPPSLFTFWLFLFKGDTRLVVLVADLQSVHMGHGSGFLRKWVFSAIGYIERLTFNCADHLIFMSDAMLIKIGRLNIKQKINVDVCYPGVTIEKNNDAKTDVLDFISHDKINIVYSGALGQKQNPSFLYSLFDAVSKLKTNYCCYILSEGDSFEHIKNMGAVEESKVIFGSLVDESQVTELYAKSFIQVVPQKPGTSDGSLPSKVPNLISNFVPIFSMTDEGGDLANLLDAYPLGRHSQSLTVSLVAEQLSVFSEDLIKRQNLTDAEKDIIEAMLDEKFSFDRFINLLHVE